jgi:hypothetical protein
MVRWRAAVNRDAAMNTESEYFHREQRRFPLEELEVNAAGDRIHTRGSRHYQANGLDEDYEEHTPYSCGSAP